MDVRSQIAMVFHLDKCIGCHTCSVACKNIWTDRPGAEYMWWNNVETKPGTGYPRRWEDQINYKGGWMLNSANELKLRSQSPASMLAKLFYHPEQPGLDDYYEPWTYQYNNLFDAPAGDDQPTAIPVSQITGQYIDINSGPNWDDDLSGSQLYASNDPNLNSLPQEEREHLLAVEQIAMMYLPRICNHCTNPACVAACPSGAIYKRGEDGIVLINQDKCRGWRACVAACPYKKVYYNWKTGKSEKCILCYPRLETGQASACFHSCVGRIRYQGVLLYDASKLPDALKVSNQDIVKAHHSVLLDPHDPEVIKGAKQNGITDDVISAAQNSPVWQFVGKWRLALPLHPEFRTLPMLYYVPSLLPVAGRFEQGNYRHDIKNLFHAIEESRISIKFYASLFAAGQEGPVLDALKKQLAVRYHMRQSDLNDNDDDFVNSLLTEARLSKNDAHDIYRLTTLASHQQRYILPATRREQTFDSCGQSAESCKGLCGLGNIQKPERGL